MFYHLQYMHAQIFVGDSGDSLLPAADPGKILGRAEQYIPPTAA